MQKYPQVVWAYFVLDAAVTLAVTTPADFTRKSLGYQVQEEPSNSRTTYEPYNVTVPEGQVAEPERIGLFVSQPQPLEPQVRASEFSAFEPRNNFGFGYTPLQKKRRGVPPPGGGLSGRYRNLYNRHGHHEYGKRGAPHGSDTYMTPDFVKFKNEIEKDTERTHLKGVKMGRDAVYSPTVVYENPKFGKYRPRNHVFEDSPLPLGDESFRRPYYDEPESESDDDVDPSPYSKPVSYNQFSSLPPSEPYMPSNFDASELQYPPYPPLPSLDSAPNTRPHSESEARNRFSFNSGYNDYPSSFQNVNGQPPTFKKPPAYHNEDEDEETAYTPSFDADQIKLPRKYADADEYTKGETASTGGDGWPHHHQIKTSRHHPKQRTKFGGRPTPSPVPESGGGDDEGDEFDANYEAPADPFLNDENLESEEEEEESPPERLRQPSKKQPKRVQQPSENHKKRCVKKRKEMSIDDPDDEPGREMVCLECKNLDTGGTYETCSYKSDPKKNSYFAGNAASYRKGASTKSPDKRRFRRQTRAAAAFDGSSRKRDDTEGSYSADPDDFGPENFSYDDDDDEELQEETSPPRQRVVRDTKKDDTEGSYSADPDDFGPENFGYDDNEELHEETDDSDDELEEYKPQPPAYANEHSCKQVVRDGSTCMVCHNPDTNGKYEQCSYANEPDDGYEYAQSSSYGKKNVPYSERSKRSLQRKAVAKIPLEWKELRDVEQQKIEKVNDFFKTLVRTKKQQPNAQFLSDVEDASFEQKFLNLFPELSDKSEKGSSLKTPDGTTDDRPPGSAAKRKLPKNVNKLPKKGQLGDQDEETSNQSKIMAFKSSDRSTCTKKLKDQMICYVCDDSDGTKREECEYVVKSDPRKGTYSESSQTAPDENEGRMVKREISQKPNPIEYKYVPPRDVQPSSQILVRKTVEARKYGTPKTVPNLYSNVRVHTEKTYTKQKAPAERVRSPKLVDEQQALGSSKRETYQDGKTDARQDEHEHEHVEDPEETGEYTAVEVVPEADPSTPDGAFTDDTEIVYDKEFKTSLPKFMVEKNEHEKIIDEFISNI